MRRLSWAVALTTLTGCVAEDAGYSDVRRVVAQRTGHDVRWHHLDGKSRTDERVRALMAKPLTAKAAVEIALYSNPELQAAFEDLGVARAEMLEAIRISNPTADAALRFHGGPPHLDVGVMQEISDFFFLPARNSAGRVGIDRASLSVGGAAMDIALDARLAFYRHVAAKQLAELSRNVLKATRASYDAARSLNEAGNITDLELANQRALYEESRLTALDADANVSATRERLTNVLGNWNQEFVVNARLTEPPSAEVDVSDLERRAIEQSLDLALVKKTFTLNAKRANLARARGILPELKAGVSAERSDGEWGVGPAVAIEIPLFYQGQGEVARAHAEMRRAERSAAALGIEIRAAARTSALHLKAARERALYVKRVLLPLRQSIVEQTLREYNAMSVGVFQLLAAKRAQIEAEKGYVEALREYWIARAEVEQLSAGRLPRGTTRTPTMSSSVMPEAAGGH